MHSSDSGDVAIRVSTLLVLTATMLGLLVWYGSIAGGRSVAASILDVLPDVTEFLAAVHGLGTVPEAMHAGWGGTSTTAVATPSVSLGSVPTFLGAQSSGLPLGSAAELLAGPLSSHRAHWEVQYMYGISALAGVWVGARLCLGWRFDPRSLAIRPQSEREDRDA